MTTHQHEQEREAKTTEEMQMGDQGPSYSSSYNESTPGEIAQNRRASLHEQDVADDQQSDRTEQ